MSNPRNTNQLKERHHFVSFSDMAHENNRAFLNHLWGLVEDHYLDRKEKTLHKKKFAPVLFEIRGHYGYHHRDDFEWVLNDLKTQEPELRPYNISFCYGYKKGRTIYWRPVVINIKHLLANGFFD